MQVQRVADMAIIAHRGGRECEGQTDDALLIKSVVLGNPPHRRTQDLARAAQVPAKRLTARGPARAAMSWSAHDKTALAQPGGVAVPSGLAG